MCDRQLTFWTYEQGCLEDILSWLQGSSHGLPMMSFDDAKKILVTPMKLVNSPWGRHVTHAWGGVGGGESVRAWTFDHELRSSHGVFNLTHAAHALLRGQGFDGVVVALRRGWRDAVFTSYRVWPLIHFLNFALVPESQRVVFTATVNLFWVAFLSVVGNRATEASKPASA